MTLYRCLLLLGWLLITPLCWANTPVVGSVMPQLIVPAGKSAGELLLKPDQSFHYQNWQTTHLRGKVRVIFHIAGRTSAKSLNKALLDAIKAAQFPQEKYQTTTLINLNDTWMNITRPVIHEAKKNKKIFPWSSIVLDASGILQKQWNLNKKSSAILVVAPTGKVVFFKDGKLSDQEVQDVLGHVRRWVQ